MLNPSLKSRFLQEFSRFSTISAGLVEEKILHWKIKNAAKNKNVKKRVFMKIIKTQKTSFTSMLSPTPYQSLIHKLTGLIT